MGHVGLSIVWGAAVQGWPAPYLAAGLVLGSGPARAVVQSRSKRPVDTRANKECSMATHSEQNTMGKRICLVRVTSGLTQGQFASFLGLPRQAVTAYETGQPVPLEVLS